MENKYINKSHTYGRLWMVVTLLVFYPTAVIEVLTYSPLLGTGGTYLSFVTGNITNLKLPAALNAMESAKVDSNSDEDEVISTISIAVSSIVTTIIIAVFVLLFRPVLKDITGEGSPFAPAFQQVTPALFGALCASYLAKHWKISILPIAVLTFILIFKGTLSTGILIPIGVVVSLLGAHLMYKKGWVGK